jgi:hypothetical protein
VKLPREILTDAARALITWVALIALIAAELNGVTLEDLRADPELNPKKLMTRISRFKYELRAEVQTPEVFLATETGDCDDFATLAALVLREKGFTPRLFAVRMPGITHVVCYVQESGVYLDYNNRAYFRSLVKCSPELGEIAGKVAKSFDSSWTTASEFLYTNQVKVMVKTIARTEGFAQTAPAPAPPRRNPPARQLDISF